MTKKTLNFLTHNDLKESHVISIFAVFKELSQKGSYKMKQFVFPKRKLLILEFQFWKILVWASALIKHCLMLQSRHKSDS